MLKDVDQKRIREQIDALLLSDGREKELDALIETLGRLRPDYVDFEEVCQNLYDGIHITDGEGKILFINKAYTRTTGIFPEEIIGKKVPDIELEGCLYKGSVTGAVLEKKERVNSVARIIKVNKDVLVTGTPVFDKQGKIKLVVTNTRDFPELKELEHRLIVLSEERNKKNEELAYMRQQQTGRKQLLYFSDAMKSVMETIKTVAETDVTVLITGETGTGKELVANELYQNSNRKDKPFIKVNCAAIPAELLESELFGYEAGAFTGAKRNGKVGMFELANTGVILLDEIGDMSLPLQAKLLRVLQQKEFIRIGGNNTVSLDIRVIASTNKNLLEEIKNKRFREDLYYRLNVVPINLKPLRERKEEIPYLAEKFCQKYNKKYNKEILISEEGMNALKKYSWPGNVRELENMIERLVVTSRGKNITSHSIFVALSPEALSSYKEIESSSTLKDMVRIYEHSIIIRTLKEEGSLRRTAKVLGVDHSTLVKKLQRYNQEFQ
ncbi:sigma-54 interaction domain-containing protein [Sinanaerobacter sp. ZZT-01]|uniref:sigma-54 interaction domain-containing protein n=1 Tax=Sinanaerobacter sp. ZZT-01 TaxID=3111540 RepID=UPI002D7A21B7|nr:sigma 54-interacting transcriptional regulator [Sinanaerobacter sp. ZZT-01]WRR95024.1 sigma 54-interacting transcriptional regulator [Sinanaerobacter sp. ZZT-01]